MSKRGFGRTPVLAALRGVGQRPPVLVEYQRVVPEPGGGQRRWYGDEACELTVWRDPADAIIGFQWCYPGPNFSEAALTWRAGKAFMHSLVDGGDTRPDKNLSPVLRPGGPVPWERIEEDFRERSAEVDPATRDFILDKLQKGKS